FSTAISRHTRTSIAARRQMSRRARSVSVAFGAFSSERSDHVVVSHNSSRRRHTRLRHTATVGRPDTAIAHDTLTSIMQPAITPQLGHASGSAVVLIAHLELAA